MRIESIMKSEKDLYLLVSWMKSKKIDKKNQNFNVYIFTVNYSTKNGVKKNEKTK